MKLATITTSILFTLLSLTIHTPAFAELNADEIACNKSLNTGDAKKALKQSEELLKIDAKNENAWTCKGRAYYLLEQPTDAIDAFKKAETHATHPYEKSFATLLSGHVYKHDNQADKAIASYQQSLDYAKQQATLQALVFSNHMNIGNIYFEQKKYKLAFKEFEAAQALAMNDNERVDSIEKLAMTHFALGEYSLALEKQLKTQILHQKVGSLDQYANASIDLGRFYTADKRYQDAEKALNQIIQFAKDQGGAYFEAKASYVLAKLKMEQPEKDEDEARTLVSHAKRIAKDTHDAALAEEIEMETKSLFE
jgi:tetratricopeptide (TPR) repeat protein